MQDLFGKTVTITGASRGIGAAAARVFAAQGANVMLLARTADEIIALADEIGPNAMALQCDVSQYDALEAAVTACTARFGGLDVLINNAGITRDNLMMRMKDDEWDDIISTNLNSLFKLR